MRLEEIQTRLAPVCPAQDIREDADGTIKWPCHICEQEGRHGKECTLFRSDGGKPTGISCEGYIGLREANREHCQEYYELLDVSVARAFVSSTLFEGDRQITLELDRASKLAQFLTARNCKDVLHSAELRMSKPDERADFVAAIPNRDDDERGAIARELVQLFDRFRKTQSVIDSSSSADDKDSAATRLVQIAEETELIHNADGDGFAVMMVDGHKETWLLRAKGFKRWLQRQFFERYQKAPGSQAVHDALGVIEGKALYDGPERRIFVRIGEKDGKIYLDLADEKWRAVEIDADGWRVVNIPPIEFKRAKGMLPLPVPVLGGSVEELRSFLLLPKGDLWTLMAGSTVMKFNPRGPYPVDVLTGGHGSGKTTRARMERELIDPSSVVTRSSPRDMRDLHISASNEWLPIFDNLSRIPEWLSDGFCCLSTGGGMRTRELHTDADEAIFSTKRPIILTSISEVVERPDLLDRSIIYNLPEIEKSDRKSEKEMWAAFYVARPRILGALLTAVSCALRNEDSVVLKDYSRMADFERWVVAAEPALGFEPGTFLRAYRKNQNSANELVLEACPIAEPIIKLAKSSGIWIGTAKELFDLLLEDKSEEEKRKLKDQDWPKAPNSLSAMLRRLAPNLKSRGITIEFNIRTDKHGSRKIRIVWTSNPDQEDRDDTQQDYGGKTPSDTVRSSEEPANHSEETSYGQGSEHRTSSEASSEDSQTSSETVADDLSDDVSIGSDDLSDDVAVDQQFSIRRTHSI
jgi:hypothetical protein